MVGQWVVIFLKSLKSVDKFGVNLISENSLIEYILEVVLEYTEGLYSLHSDYPLAPEKLAIPYDMLSSYSKKLADEHGTVGHVKKINPKFG